MIKRRNPVMVPILSVITLGIYGLVWFYSTSDELIRYNKMNANPFAWLILALIPLANLIAIWSHAQAVAQMTREGNGKGINGTVMFLLWFVPFAGIIVSQLELNKRATDG